MGPGAAMGLWGALSPPPGAHGAHPTGTQVRSASPARTRRARGCCTRWSAGSSTCTSRPCTSALTRSASSTSPAAPPPPAPSTSRSRPSRARSTPSAASRGGCGSGCAAPGSAPGPHPALLQGGVREALRLRQCQEAEHQEPWPEGGTCPCRAAAPCQPGCSPLSQFCSFALLFC